MKRTSLLVADFGRLMVLAFQQTHTHSFMAVLSMGSFVPGALKYTGPFKPLPHLPSDPAHSPQCQREHPESSEVPFSVHG